MKKTSLCRWLAALLAVCSTSVALATTEMVITYEGAYASFPAHRFMLYLPDTWQLASTGPARYTATDAGTGHAMQLTIYENSAGHTLDTFLALCERSPAYTEVAPVFFSGFPFVLYTDPAESSWHAATLSAEGGFLYDFAFSPADDGNLRTLALQILSSLAPI